MPYLIILKGLPASGKTSFAQAWIEGDPTHRIRVNYDDLRIELYGEDWKFNRVEEAIMKGEALNRAQTALLDGKSVIVDNTHLTEGARAPWVNLAKQLDVPYEIADFTLADISVEDCILRDRKRKGKARVGQAVIDRMALWNNLLDWDFDGDQSKFIIVDMDGTLTDTSHRVHHVRNVENKKNWPAFFAACDEDPPHEVVVNLVKDLSNGLEYSIIIVSGRPIDLCGIKTEDWLLKHEIPYDYLFMRQGGDNRSDVIVKQEILDKILEKISKERIAYVFDDRDAVVKMWRDNGLTCLQVAEGDF